MTHHNTGSFYDILGVSPKATPDQIRRAFLAQARRHHPDLNRDDPQAEWRFKRIRRVYEVLIDPLQRAAYDDFPARFSLDDVGNDWNNQTTIVTEPSRRRRAEDSGTRHRGTGSGERGVSGLWLRTERTKQHRSGLLALSLIVLIVLGVVTWMLPQPARQPTRRAIAKASTRFDAGSNKKASTQPGPTSATEQPAGPAVSPPPEPPAPSQQAAGAIPSPAKVPDGIGRALRAVPFPNPLAPWEVTWPPAGRPGSAFLPPLPPSPGPWEVPSIDPWPRHRNDFHSVVNAPSGPASVPSFPVDLQPKPPLTGDPLAPTQPHFDQSLSGIGTVPSAAYSRYVRIEPIPPAAAPGYHPGTPQLDAVGRENLVIGLRERLNPAGGMLPTFPAGLPSTPSAPLPYGPIYPSTADPLAGFSPAPPTPGRTNGLPFLPPAVLTPTPVALPQRPAMPTASEVGISPPYFGPSPPAPRRP